MTTLNFKITSDQFSKKLKEAKLPETNTGSGSFKGVSLNYVYDGKENLTITVIKKPIIVSSAYVESKITAWLLD